jgi:hypothetical protein
MHEEWDNVRRTAEASVRITDAPSVFVSKRSNGVGAWQIEYQPFRVDVACTWPDMRIGSATMSVHIHANERLWGGALSPLRTTLLLTDLIEVHEWLKSLVLSAQAKCFGSS